MMKKILFLFCLLVVPFALFSQKQSITIDWGTTSKNQSFSNNKTNSDTKKKPIIPLLRLLESQKMKYYKQWVDTGFADEASLEITNVSYSNLSVNELKLLDKKLISNKLSYSISSNKARNIIYTSLAITPIVKINGQYKKIVSFDIDYKKNPNSRNANAIPITNSVLATGNWYKFKVDQTGIYKIDKSFLNSLGMNTDGINPRNIKIYGNGGKALPFRNIENTIFDLPETSIQVVGEADGSFDGNDYILFYGISSRGFQGNNFDTNINPYSDESYYYITADGDLGKRVQEMVEPSGEPVYVIDRYNEYQFIESDEISPVKVGRRWFSNRFDIESNQTFSLSFPNIIFGEPMFVKVKVASASESSTSMAISINGTSVNPLTFIPISDPNLLSSRQHIGFVPAGSETITFDLAYNNGGNPSSIGYLDYISVDAIVQLKGRNKQMSFRSEFANDNPGIGEYQISDAQQFSQVWDVNDIGFITAKQNTENSNIFTFKANFGETREYVAINRNDYYTPIKGVQTTVANQNLKGTIFNDESGNFKDIDYLIVTAPFLLQPALRLANHRKNIDGLNVKVVTTDKIYEEFSSGKQDIAAIRNFVRYVYENASSDENRIKYLCLFGDTSLDYKDRLQNNNNVVPTFHTYNSDSTFHSFMSDDFFGNMDPSEGLMLASEKLDIAVGRILVDNVSLANQMVDKIVNYESKASYGNWRNDFVLISDDVDEDWEFEDLQVNLDVLGDQVSAERPYTNVKKIHSDAYQQVASAGGDRYPDVNDAFESAIEVGALIINYFGHGGEDGLAKEAIYTKETGINLKNEGNYNCFVTVTCEFTKFDNPLRITAGELTYWNKEGGAVAMVTTTRSISVFVGVEFNQVLAPELFGFGMEVPVPPAEAVRITKNQLDSPNRRVVFYIGDPAMHLAFPRQKIKLTAINDVPLAEATEVLKALDKVKFSGEVQDINGNLLTGYNGILEAKLYDKNTERSTLGNDGVHIDGELAIMDFITLGEVLFNGKATVANGKFDFEFVMPRDTQIPVGNGRISFYSQENNALKDQTGYNIDIKIGGLNENAPEDNQGPLINLFMNDENFVSGGITNNSPILIAKLSDENGLNTASGIGHDMVAILDGDVSNPFVINEYYQADTDSYTSGIANFKLRDLEEGLHTLSFKAWDVYNNSSTTEIQFVVAGNDKLEINHVLNYPNPFVNYTEFWFNHNRPYEPLEVQVQVFTVTGKVVWTRNQIINTDGFLSRGDIIWDGKDDFGDRIGKGVYVYKITVKSTLTNQRVEKYEKLVIL